ncbi:MAG: DNA-directed RNA polymerase subunit alpha C-terminal domain-containing protein [Planctomycetota bacterium]
MTEPAATLSHDTGSVTFDLLKSPNTPASALVQFRRRVLSRLITARQLERTLEDAFPAGETTRSRERGLGLWILAHLEEAEKLLAPLAGDPVVKFALADIALRQDRVPQAITALRELSERFPAEPLYLFTLADALARTPDTFGFERAAESYLKLRQSGADAHYLRGLIYEKQGDYPQAAVEYESAQAEDPQHASSLFRLANYHMQWGDEDKALELYERARTVGPTPIAALLNLGMLYEDREQYQKAVDCFQMVLAYFPNHERARLYLRDALASQNMYYDEEKERKEDKKAQILRIPVTDFELSVRSRNCLQKMNIRSLGDLIKKTEAELLAFKNFGETSLAEIKEILRQKGLRLGMVAEDTDRKETVRQPVDPDSALGKPVGDLDLSVRSRKALDFLKVQTVGDLIKITEAELLACKNFGQTSLNEIKKKLEDMGLSLRS